MSAGRLIATDTSQWAPCAVVPIGRERGNVLFLIKEIISSCITMDPNNLCQLHDYMAFEWKS